MGDMEFYAERRIKATRKPHTCELCGATIKKGDPCYQEKGVFYHEFFSRYLHVACHIMEIEYCSNVDNEFSWDEISDYIQNKYCRDCEHSPLNDDKEDWKECPYTSLHKCEKLIKQFLDESEG